MDWHASEETTRRAVRHLTFATVYRRVYAISPKVIASTIPARGDSVTVVGITAATHAHDLLDLRVLDLGYVSAQKGPILTWIDFIEPLPYGSAAGSSHYQELLGSRTVPEDTRRRRALVRIGVSDTKADAPAEGDMLAGDSGLMGLQCVDAPWISPDQSPVPGLWYQRALYTAFQTYRGT